MPVSAKLDDAVTEQRCDHVVGFALAVFPQHGETDRIVKESERETVDQAFRFCPLCGIELIQATPEMPKQTALCERLLSL